MSKPTFYEIGRPPCTTHCQHIDKIRVKSKHGAACLYFIFNSWYYYSCMWMCVQRTYHTSNSFSGKYSWWLVSGINLNLAYFCPNDNTCKYHGRTSNLLFTYTAQWLFYTRTRVLEYCQVHVVPVVTGLSRLITRRSALIHHVPVRVNERTSTRSYDYSSTYMYRSE